MSAGWFRFGTTGTRKGVVLSDKDRNGRLSKEVKNFVSICAFMTHALTRPLSRNCRGNLSQKARRRCPTLCSMVNPRYEHVWFTLCAELSRLLTESKTWSFGTIGINSFFAVPRSWARTRKLVIFVGSERGRSAKAPCLLRRLSRASSVALILNKSKKKQTLWCCLTCMHNSFLPMKIENARVIVTYHTRTYDLLWAALPMLIKSIQTSTHPGSGCRNVQGHRHCCFAALGSASSFEGKAVFSFIKSLNQRWLREWKMHYYSWQCLQNLVK